MRVLIEINGFNIHGRSYLADWNWVAVKVAQGGALELGIQQAMLQATYPDSKYVLLSDQESRDWFDDEVQGSSM